MVQALARELFLRKNELCESVESIYFGGGTPSLLKIEELHFLIDEVYNNYAVCNNPEITLEANPDDLTAAYIKELSKTPVNRLSIGVQSFFEDDLKLINRAHNAKEALESVREAKKFFNNITIDLIYGIPNMSVEKWKQNIKTALLLDVPHISAYALTVEPKTALKKLIEKQKVPPVKDAVSQQHYKILVEKLMQAGYVNYEFSNFGKPGYFSKNNTAYWTGKPYLGIGPSAHSFNGKQRSWNSKNNILYIKNMQQDKLKQNVEMLSVIERYNEYIMTGLRTMWGVNLDNVESRFGIKYRIYLLKQAKKYLENGFLIFSEKDQTIHLSKKGKFLGDGISADLFYVEKQD